MCVCLLLEGQGFLIDVAREQFMSVQVCTAGLIDREALVLGEKLGTLSICALLVIVMIVHPNV